MSTQHAAFWDNPESQGNTPVIRHAPDQHNYHLPDSDQLSHMRGSKVGRFATIPAANRDGTSKGFDPTVAGPVHVDPDAPDGGVIFDPNNVRKGDVNRAVNASQYAHQAFYALGTPAPLMGIGRNKLAGYGQHQSNGFDVDRGPNPHMPNTYVTPSAENGRQAEIPSFVANGYGPGLASAPQYRAQEEQALNPVPPLGQLPPLGPVQMAAPQPMQAPQPQQPQYATPGYFPPQQPQPQHYPPPQYAQPPQSYAPPPMDPAMQAMMAGMVGLQNTVAALAAQVQQGQRAPLPPTTGVSQNPLPVGRPPVPLSTMPVEMQQGRRGGRGQYDKDDRDDGDFEDTARPIRKQVKRNKQTQEIESEEDNSREERSLVSRRNRENEDEGRQTVRQVEEHNQEPEGVIYGFESLELPFVDGPIARKAKKKVIFEIPGAGNHMAQFHDVIVSKECVVLVYDTRYEEGTQYIPPELGEVVITVRAMGKDKNGKDAKSYKVSSMGFSYSFGVFDHIVLVKNEEEQVDYEDDK